MILELYFQNTGDKELVLENSNIYIVYSKKLFLEIYNYRNIRISNMYL